MRRLRHISLRARLALLTGLAVALAVAAVALSAWFITRDQLRNQLDDSLATSAARFAGPRNPAFEVCAGRPQPPAFQDLLITYQVVYADGSSCVDPFGTALDVTPADVAVANGVAPEVYHDTRDADGTRMRVLTRYAGPGTGTAVSVARPLTEVEGALDSLALLLTVVSAIGVVGAVTTGLVVARAALRPVDRLTGAVEHIARTDDLDTTIPVSGKDEIARLGTSFNAMTASLKASREHQRRLIADAGHELRTPLTSLRTNTDLLLRAEELGRELPPDDKRRMLRSIRAQLRELSGLVGDLLELARPERARGTPVTGTAALHDVVGRAVERARPRGPGVRFETDIGPWYVRGDEASLERAVINVLDNAVKFGPPGGSVEVRLRDGELTVRDHGPGIPADDLPHVFERFWRSDEARALPGSGLGLAIVARAVDEAGGSVDLEPADGGGTVVRMRLPGAATGPKDGTGGGRNAGTGNGAREGAGDGTGDGTGAGDVG